MLVARSVIAAIFFLDGGRDASRPPLQPRLIVPTKSDRGVRGWNMLIRSTWRANPNNYYGDTQEPSPIFRPCLSGWGRDRDRDTVRLQRRLFFLRRRHRRDNVDLKRCTTNATPEGSFLNPILPQQRGGGRGGRYVCSFAR